MSSFLARGPEQLLRLAGTLADGFYLLAFVALLAALTGAPDLGLLFLGVAGALHAARIGLEETARGRGEIAEPEGEDFRVYAARPGRRRAKGGRALPTPASVRRARPRRTAGTRR